ncbi:MAG: hypothetical protein FWE78_04615 [Methanimicrococcus sp.]|nr:hypothetical protein [Methanimicrococcus sp.]
MLFAASALSLPAVANEERNIDVIISDGYIILRDESPQNFQQGYAVSLKGYGADNVLIEFRCNYSTPLTIGSVVLTEGETVQCFRRTSEGTDLVLMLTLDKMYLNNSQIIAGFSHVYQMNDVNFGNYSDSGDWTLYADFLDDPSVPDRPGGPSRNGTDIRQDLISEPLYIILLIGLIACIVIVIAAVSKKDSRKK